MYTKTQNSFFSSDDFTLGLDPMDEVDGFNSCTETLGFESSNSGSQPIDDCSTIAGRAKRRSAERKRVIELPPPLTRRDFILKPVRENGRLQINEVRIQRREIMRATRENGRLTLRFVGEEDDEIEEEETEDCDGEECWSPVGAGRRCCEYEVARHRNVWSPRFVTTM